MAFACLKVLFTTAPVLSHPDQAWQFLVEVDASDTGLGAVLSQRNDKYGKMYPTAFFSGRLSQAERNYVMGNRVLLALVLAAGIAPLA